jgi:ATP-dependent Clp protease adaptor protein ClpS
MRMGDQVGTGEAAAATWRLAGPATPVRRPAVPKTASVVKPDLEPPYHVILIDDDEHTYAYVIEMLMTLFGHSFETAFKLADKVNADSRVIVATVHKELAELRQEQIQEFGADPRVEECQGSMRATIEPAA